MITRFYREHFDHVCVQAYQSHFRDNRQRESHPVGTFRMS